MELQFFADMAWKSALISGAALALASALRSRSAADRTLVLRIGVTMLLLLPAIAVGLPALEIVAFAAPEPLAPLPPGVAADFAATLATASPAAIAPPAEPSIWDDPTPLVLLAYLGGVVWVGSRLLAGLFMLDRWTRAAHEVTDSAWLAAFDRVRWSVPNAEAVRLLASDEIGSPLSWGWRRPVILIDTDTLGQPEDADAILAHEVAHAARRDWPALILSRLAATLFWFNPLVWMLEREVVQQAEEAADAEAAGCVDPARYAETLLAWARVNAPVPANSIAPSARALGRRVRAVLDRRTRERPSGSAWTAIAMLLCMGLAAPVAAVQLVNAAPEPPAAPPVPGAPAAPSAPSALPGVPAVPAPPAPPGVIDYGNVVVSAPEVSAAVDEALAAVLPRIPAIVASATAALHPETAQEALRAAEAEMRRMPHMNRAEIDAAMREARREMARIRVAQPHIDRAEIEGAMREAQREMARVRVVAPRAEIERAMRVAHAQVAAAPVAMAVSMAHSADGMMRGAEGMERGAASMEAEARRLQDRDYRERAIARARARGETVTHEELIEAAEGMREGAEGMREGARGMREAAREMRTRHN